MNIHRNTKSQSTATKICGLISELTQNLHALERQEKLRIVSRAEAESIRTSIKQSIADLQAIHAMDSEPMS